LPNTIGEPGTDEGTNFDFVDILGYEPTKLLFGESGTTGEEIEGGSCERERFEIGDENILEMADAHNRILSLRVGVVEKPGRSLSKSRMDSRARFRKKTGPGERK
jgi:hypothetical protein